MKSLAPDILVLYNKASTCPPSSSIPTEFYGPYLEPQTYKVNQASPLSFTYLDFTVIGQLKVSTMIGTYQTTIWSSQRAP